MGQPAIPEIIRKPQSFAGSGGRSYLDFIFYLTIAELAVFLSLAVSALISYYPPPHTFSYLFRTGNLSLPDSSDSPACHGRLCTLCERKCFLQEGMRGECGMRINSDSRIIYE